MPASIVSHQIWPLLICLAVLLAVASIPAFSRLDVPPSGLLVRRSNLDGLRGFLALSVFFHHAAIYVYVLQDGNWVDPPHFYRALGQFGVSVFFMITGYLFWGKLLAEKGRPDWLRFYIGRLFRIGPAYLLAVAVMLAIVFCRTGFQLHVPASQLAREIGGWLALGFNGGGQDVNGYKQSSLLLFSVTWTLSSEWKFYASMVVLAIAARHRRFQLLPLLIGLLICAVYSLARPTPDIMSTTVRCMLFLSGMICASLERLGVIPALPRHLASVLVIALLFYALVVLDSAYTAAGVILMAAAFYLIVSGANLFGLLTSRPARRLGDVSYSMYLLQGLVVTLFFTLPGTRIFALSSATNYWLAVITCSVLLFLASSCSYVLIERPGIELGKLVARLPHRLLRRSPAVARPQALLHRRLPLTAAELDEA